MSDQIFRKEALQRLSGPEQLDQLLRVTSPLGWTALGIALALILAGLSWSIFGSYRVTVSGRGLLVPTNGAFVSVYAPKSGWIESYVRRGDSVKQGDLIAKLSAPEDAARLEDANNRVIQLKDHRAMLSARFEEHFRQENLAADQKRNALREVITLGHARVKDLEALLEARESLQARGMATSDRVLEVRERLFAARESISRAHSETASVDAMLLSLRGRHDQELAALDRQLRDSQGQRDQIRLVENLATSIRARVDGDVVANEVSQYAMVSAGQKLMVIERGESRLEALLYVTPESGKEIRPGMEVRLSPSYLKKEEYGTLIGTVVDVDKAPESEAALAEILGNLNLARQFMQEGPPLQLVIRLEPAPGDADGYAWTSQRGEDIELRSMTLLTGQVTVRTGRPIGLFIPALRRWVGI